MNRHERATTPLRSTSALLTSSEGRDAPVHRVPLPVQAAPAPDPTDVGPVEQPAEEDGGPPRAALAVVALLVGLTGFGLAVRRSR